MSFNVIVAMDEKCGIGKNNKLPWRNPEDLKLFKEKTIDGVVIMGRITYDSLGKTLHGRLNIVLSRTRETQESKNPLYFNSLDKALDYCYSEKKKNIWVIGGSQIYKEAVYHSKCKEIHITNIKGVYDCDTFFHYPLYEKNFFITNTKRINENATLSIFKRRNIEEEQYIRTLSDILMEGIERNDRTGVGTIAVFGRQFRFDLSKTFPLFTCKKSFLRGIFEELMMILRGQTDSKILEEKGINIWKGNSTREFLDSRNLFEYKEGLIGPTYGWSMRNLGAKYDEKTGESNFTGFDQLLDVLNLIKNEPSSRRIVIDLWDSHYSEKMALTPCMMVYNFFCDTVNKKLNLHMFIRSSDSFLGFPWNVAYSALFVYLICNVKGIEFTPGELVISTTDQHIYKTHLDQVHELITREPFLFPILEIKRKVDDITTFSFSDLNLRLYESHPSLKGEMAV